MKYLLISDIHGDLKAMDSLEKKFNDLHCEGIICLGDLLYHGPRNDLPSFYNPKKVIEIIKKHLDHFIWVKGNCDAEVDDMVIGKAAIKEFRFSINNRDVIFTHGHHLSRFEPRKNLNKNSVIIYGHYHVFDISQIDGNIYINIGSPTIPKDGIPQYGVLDGNTIEVFSLDDKLIGRYEI